MKITFLTHPRFLPSQSMPRYTNWLANSMKNRGHEVTVWAPKAVFYRFPIPRALKKWMGYIDQYVLFPLWIKKQLKKSNSDTLYVFTDHALGPWVPYLVQFPHVIHCHDFLAQRSALGEIPENPTGASGKAYQAFIRRGYRKGKNFISISQKTKRDLHRFLISKPQLSEVVYNGLNRKFQPATDLTIVRKALEKEFNLKLSAGFLLHVGGNQWYKNRPGVIEIYTAWRRQSSLTLPLVLIGALPNESLNKAHQKSEYQQDIFPLTDVSDSQVQDFYATANVLLFPSFAEGFGWPIIEAMASGCPVVTTNDAPMNEVGGNAATYIDRRPNGNLEDVARWAQTSANVLESVLNNPHRQQLIDQGFLNVKRFDAENALNNIEKIYNEILPE
ncbi:glycosyltransferase family 4 protein [Parapedobacter sp. DT-150]|uniref:glycosyltransferase family 4 protein n=1 Tax=Parapedobacter sp. DT-150 TaxID=3396162 RepID=UPI003F1B21D6